METPMLDTLKTYFGISDTSADNILNIIIDWVEDLISALSINESLELPMCIESYSYFLRSGNSSFSVSQPSDGLAIFSPSLQSLIHMSMAVRVYG